LYDLEVKTENLRDGFFACLVGVGFPQSIGIVLGQMPPNVMELGFTFYFLPKWTILNGTLFPSFSAGYS